MPKTTPHSTPERSALRVVSRRTTREGFPPAGAGFDGTGVADDGVGRARRPAAESVGMGRCRLGRRVVGAVVSQEELLEGRFTAEQARGHPNWPAP